MKKIKSKNWLNKHKSNFEGVEYTDIKFIASLSDVPINIGMNIFVVKNGGRYKWAIIKCPDNCGNRIEVNLMKSKYPFWILRVRKNKATISPSLVVQGCNSHFWLKDNRVEWAKFEHE